MAHHNKRTKKFLGTALQNKLLLVLFLCAVIPMAIAVLSLYYLVFNLLAWQIGIPEEISNNLVPVVQKINIIILVALPIVLFIMWLVALEISHRIAGPLLRLERDLDDHISGKSHGQIKLRPKDELKILTDKINKLICK